MFPSTVRATWWSALLGILALVLGSACQDQQAAAPSIPTATITITGAQQESWSYTGEINNIRCRSEPGALTIWVSNIPNAPNPENAFHFLKLGWRGVPTDDQWPVFADPTAGIYEFPEVWVGGGYRYGNATDTSNLDGEELTTWCIFWPTLSRSASGNDWLDVTIRCYNAFARQNSLDYETDPADHQPWVDVEAQVCCELEGV